MSWMTLYQLGRSRPPKTARRRLLWTAFTVVLSLLIGGALAVASVAAWIAAAGRGTDADALGEAPGVGEAIVAGLAALLLIGIAIYSAVVGSRRVREDRAREAESAQLEARVREARQRLRGR